MGNDQERSVFYVEKEKRFYSSLSQITVSDFVDASLVELSWLQCDRSKKCFKKVGSPEGMSFLKKIKLQLGVQSLTAVISVGRSACCRPTRPMCSSVKCHFRNWPVTSVYPWVKLTGFRGKTNRHWALKKC